jgi:hypothetical protein
MSKILNPVTDQTGSCVIASDSHLVLVPTRVTAIVCTGPYSSTFCSECLRET